MRQSRDMQSLCKILDLLINNYQARTVSFGTFENLRGYQVNGVYLNDIKQIEKELFPKNTSGSKCIETFKFIYNKSDKQLHPTV